ncbi:hypothetical protein L6R53_13865 [Myxococcota bacterium]|nr:hypothetical protein [Myxococcota bacterium]
MSADAVTLAWAGILVVQALTWSVAFLRTLRAPPGVRLPVLLAAVPGMYGTLVFGLFVQTWVVGHPPDWTPRPGAWEVAWQPWWGPLAGGAPVVAAMGLYGLWLDRRAGWTRAACVTGLASAAAAVTVLAALPAT